LSPENRQEMARAELTRAEEALRAAEALLVLGLSRDAVSRGYYAVFHAACALLARLDAQPRTHRGVQRLLKERLVTPGHLSAGHHRAFNRLQERRTVADYGVDEVAIEEARELVELARAFVAEATKLDASLTG
jgi:uncharacterized protein